MGAEVDVSIWADDGDDFVFIDNSSTKIELAPEQPSGGAWDELYRAGLRGDISMGNGNDVLELNLNDAFAPETEAILDGGNGVNRLVLHHLTQDEVSNVLQNADGSWTLTYGTQTLEIRGFEQIVFGSGDLLI